MVTFVRFVNDEVNRLMPRNGEARKIALVDDDEGVRSMFGNVLRYLGHMVVEFESGDSVIEAWVQGGFVFDVLVTDHRMPHMLGESLSLQLRKHGFAGPIVVHSSSLSSEVRQLYEPIGRISFLNKPATIIDVSGCLSALEGR